MFVLAVGIVNMPMFVLGALVLPAKVAFGDVRNVTDRAVHDRGAALQLHYLADSRHLLRHRYASLPLHGCLGATHRGRSKAPTNSREHDHVVGL